LCFRKPGFYCFGAQQRAEQNETKTKRIETEFLVVTFPRHSLAISNLFITSLKEGPASFAPSSVFEFSVFEI
jgi:hypothetical protein